MNKENLIGQYQRSHYSEHSVDEDCISISSLPERFRGVFTYRNFNAVQSACFETIMQVDHNVVISAPTGSGKTCMMELAICRLYSHSTASQFKTIYFAPTKALCNERTKDWSDKFKPLGIICQELTGDTGYELTRKALTGDIIITTPEKWDSLTRRWEDNEMLIKTIRLLLIDEVHIIHEPKRGQVLEVIISRMQSLISKSCYMEKSRKIDNDRKLRIVAISATVPNVYDIAEWLSNSDGTTASVKTRIFGEEFRPVKLRKEVLGFAASGPFVLDKMLTYKLMENIIQFSAQKPTLINSRTRDSLLAMKNKLEDKLLAGMSINDRQAIEQAFINCTVSVICTTSTLAVGVNLPAHLVIIKGTLSFNNGKSIEYSELDIAQMIGRAGRPQFDNSGVAIIMTENSCVEKYKRLVSGSQTIESSVQKNPSHYQLIGGEIDRQLALICKRELQLLHENQFALWDTEKDIICSTRFIGLMLVFMQEFGQILAKYYIQFETGLVEMCTAKEDGVAARNALSL
ncbi:P-loop containing nucleoside triphosphate hydrolase protein [Cladochytrium replicatum]|nr:P-loop containing nucleoside triphosphate hydrolase protein [Cladochytrium replicatum]